MPKKLKPIFSDIRQPNKVTDRQQTNWMIKHRSEAIFFGCFKTRVKTDLLTLEIVTEAITR